MKVDVCGPEDSRRRRFAVEAAGRLLAVFWPRGAEAPVVTDGRCPHAGAPMQDGWLYGGAVVCPWHRYRFSPEDGSCANNGRYRLPVYPVSMSDGRFVADVPFNPLGSGSYPRGRDRGR